MTIYRSFKKPVAGVLASLVLTTASQAALVTYRLSGIGLISNLDYNYTFTWTVDTDVEGVKISETSWKYTDAIVSGFLEYQRKNTTGDPIHVDIDPNGIYNQISVQRTNVNTMQFDLLAAPANDPVSGQYFMGLTIKDVSDYEMIGDNDFSSTPIFEFFGEEDTYALSYRRTTGSTGYFSAGKNAGFPVPDSFTYSHSAIPEPSTTGLLALLAVLGCIRRKR